MDINSLRLPKSMLVKRKTRDTPYKVNCLLSCVLLTVYLGSKIINTKYGLELDERNITVVYVVQLD